MASFHMIIISLSPLLVETVRCPCRSTTMCFRISTGHVCSASAPYTALADPVQETDQQIRQLVASVAELQTKTNGNEVAQLQLKASVEDLRKVVLALAQKNKDSSSGNGNGDGKQPMSAGESSSGPIVCPMSFRYGGRLRIENS